MNNEERAERRIHKMLLAGLIGVVLILIASFAMAQDCKSGSRVNPCGDPDKSQHYTLDPAETVSFELVEWGKMVCVEGARYRANGCIFAAKNGSRHIRITDKKTIWGKRLVAPMIETVKHECEHAAWGNGHAAMTLDRKRNKWVEPINQSRSDDPQRSAKIVHFNRCMEQFHAFLEEVL